MDRIMIDKLTGENRRSKLDDIINPLPDTASGQSIVFETDQQKKQDIKDLFSDIVKGNKMPNGVRTDLIRKISQL